MSKPRIQRLAEAIKSLTYDEMMDVADWFALATSYDGEDPDDVTVAQTDAARLLSDFANSYPSED